MDLANFADLAFHFHAALLSIERLSAKKMIDSITFNHSISLKEIPVSGTIGSM